MRVEGGFTALSESDGPPGPSEEAAGGWNALYKKTDYKELDLDPPKASWNPLGGLYGPLYAALCFPLYGRCIGLR